MEPITTIKNFLTPGILFTLLISNIGSSIPARGQDDGEEPEETSCTVSKSSSLSHHLTEYLRKPSASSTQELTVDLCQASPNGPSPCPIRMSEDRVADFQKAAARPGGIMIVPVIACGAKMAEGDVAEELNELLAKLLDKHQSQFFSAWSKIPKEVKDTAAKFDDFAMMAPQSVDDFHKKIKVWEARIRILESAPSHLKPDIAEVLTQLKDEVAQAHSELKTVLPNENEITFKTSKFYEKITDKFVRLRSQDDEQDLERKNALANQILPEEGLNYRAYLKSNNRDWNICSTASYSAASCKVTAVAFRQNENSCGKYGILGVLSQQGGVWTIASSMARSNFRINASEVLTPTSVLLQKSDSVVRFWNIPEGFIPILISPDLRDIFLKTTIKTSSGSKLGDLILLVRSSGAIQFLDIKDKKTLIPIGAQSIQTVKGPDNSDYQIHLPKVCK